LNPYRWTPVYVGAVRDRPVPAVSSLLASGQPNGVRSFRGPPPYRRKAFGKRRSPGQWSLQPFILPSPTETNVSYPRLRNNFWLGLDRRSADRGAAVLFRRTLPPSFSPHGRVRPTYITALVKMFPALTHVLRIFISTSRVPSTVYNFSLFLPGFFGKPQTSGWLDENAQTSSLSQVSFLQLWLPTGSFSTPLAGPWSPD